jgi:hypothetical protein
MAMERPLNAPQGVIHELTLEKQTFHCGKTEFIL